MVRLYLFCSCGEVEATRGEGILAGNPAKVVRRNIEWEARQTKEFTDNLSI